MEFEKFIKWLLLCFSCFCRSSVSNSATVANVILYLQPPSTTLSKSRKAAKYKPNLFLERAIFPFLYFVSSQRFPVIFLLLLSLPRFPFLFLHAVKYRFSITVSLSVSISTSSFVFNHVDTTLYG